MSDITTVWDVELAQGDWIVQGADLAAGDDLQSAVLISVFTDRAAGPDDRLPDGSEDRRGWWGDQGEDKPIGSKLWLRARSKQTDETLNLVKDDIAEALQWLLDDGVAATVAIDAEWVRRGFLGVTITIARSDDAPRNFRFDWAWQEFA